VKKESERERKKKEGKKKEKTKRKRGKNPENENRNNTTTNTTHETGRIKTTSIPPSCSERVVTRTSLHSSSAGLDKPAR
jgi:TFIIF-interacting CTD phosphatase-like protein